METKTEQSIPSQIFDKLEKDILGRCGLGDAWTSIDDSIIEFEIKPEWEAIIQNEIKDLGKPTNDPPSADDAEIKLFAVNLAVKLCGRYSGKELYISDVCESPRQMAEHKLKKEGWIKSQKTDTK